MRAKAVLTITIHYDNVESTKDIEHTLRYAATHLAGNGLLSSDDGPEVVDEWDFTLDVQTKED